MSLDPQCEAILKGLESMGMPPIEQMTPEAARQTFSPEAFGALMGPAEDVANVAQVDIPGPGGPVPAIVYTPEGEGPFPVVVYFHGGGWVLGSAGLADPVCRALCNRTGAVVLNVEYRLAPEHPYPAATEDACAATLWAHLNAAEIGGDGRVAVCGDSAGGNLAAVVCLAARELGGPPIWFQALVYPVVDWGRDYPSLKENAEGYLLTTASMEWFWDHYVPDKDTRAEAWAAPMRADDLSGLPPAAVFTCEFDPLRDEGEAYADALRSAGVPATSARYAGAIHGILWMAGATDLGKRLLFDVSRALKDGFGME